MGKIYSMLNRDAGVEGLGALLTYSISESSGSIKNLSTPSCMKQDPYMPLYAMKTMKNKARGMIGKLQQITSGQYYSPKPSATQPPAHHSL